jgi:hypothetical protein
MAFNGRFKKDNKSFHSFPPHRRGRVRVGVKLPGNAISFYIVPSNPAYCRIGEELQLRQEMNLGVAGVSRALKGAESVFRENPEIKQRILSATGK